MDKETSDQQSPRNSTAFQTVRAAAIARGHAGETWDSLAFALGMLPSLRAHGPALHAAAQFLKAPVFREAKLWAPEDVLHRIPSWLELLSDWAAIDAACPKLRRLLRPTLSTGLGGSPKHPLRRHGIQVAPMMSVLMVRHPFSREDHPGSQLARRFAHVLSMLLAAWIHQRWSSKATIEEYLDWLPDGRNEFAPHPIGAGPACRTARWLSEQKQPKLFVSISDSCDPKLFVSSMEKWAEEVTPPPRPLNAERPESIEEQHLRTYPSALASYFSHWADAVGSSTTGEVVQPRGRQGGGGSGGGTAVDGFVGRPETPPAPPDTPIPPTPSGPPDLTKSRYRDGGLAGDDERSIELPLVKPSEIDGLLSRQKWGAMRAAMRDTVTPFDLRHLRPADATALAAHAVAAASVAISNPTASSAAAEDALLTLLTLALGQSPDVVSQTRLALLASAEPGESSHQPQRHGLLPTLTLDQALNLQTPVPILLVRPRANAQSAATRPDVGGQLEDAGAHAPGDEISRPSLPKAVGFLVPAITPHLAGQRDPCSEEPSRRQTVRNLLIPAGVVGELLAAHFLKEWRQRPRVESGEADQQSQPPGLLLFRTVEAPAASDPKAMRRRVADFLNGALGAERLEPPRGFNAWSSDLLQQVLPTHVEARTGDRTQAWLLSADPGGATQARLYYTQHTLLRLAQTWVDAMHSAGLQVLLSEEAPAAPQTGGDSRPASAALPRHGPWRDPLLATSTVGARFVPSIADVRGLVSTLQARVKEPVKRERRSALRSHHHHLLLLTLVYQGLCTALRALRSPVTLMRAVEQSDHVRGRAGLSPTDEVYAGLADKESFYSHRARLVGLPPLLVQQLRILRAHQIALVTRLNRVQQWQAASPSIRAMFRLDDNDEPAEVSVAWVEESLAELGFPWPANFARAFLRTRLFERGCAPADLDALLGHRDAGGGAIGLHATLDFEGSLARVQAALAELHEEIGLLVMPSALVTVAPSPDAEVLLAPMHRAGPLGRGRSERPRQQGRPPDWPELWQSVHRRATDDDRRQVPTLLRLLQRWARHGNALAQLLCAPDPAAFAAAYRIKAQAAEQFGTEHFGAEAQEIVDRLKQLAENGQRARFQRAASWFRLLGRAQRLLGNRGVAMPQFPLVAIVRPPASPFVERAVLALPIVDGWRAALLNWMGEVLPQARQQRSEVSPAVSPSQRSAEEWAAALVISAACNGMLLDLAQLSMLLRRFSSSNGRHLPLSGPHQRAHLDFHVAASGALQRQTHRWWFDPLTELIWLNAPAMLQELTLGDIHPWLRRLALNAFKGSVKMPFEPASFSDLIRCCEVWWLARASRTVVASQRRQTDASSILTERWGRLAGARRLVAPASVQSDAAPTQPPAAVAANATKPRRRRTSRAPGQSEYGELALVKGAGERASAPATDWAPEPADAELLASLEVAHPWIQQLKHALSALPTAPSAADLEGLRRAATPLPSATAEALVAFAVWLADPAGAGFAGQQLVTAFTAAAQAIALHGRLAPDAELPQAEDLAEIIRELDDLPLTEGSTVQSMRRALLRLGQFLGLEPQLTAALEGEEGLASDDDDHASHADACVLSHEEYAAILQEMLDRRYPRVSLGTRARGRLLLTLCFRLALRPGEVYGLRLQDVTPTDVYVLPYGAHRLKSANARRRIPLDALMSSDERAALTRFVQMRLEKGAKPEDRLLGGMSSQAVNRQWLDAWVHQVMRDVTQDPQVRLYHARHSLGTWADLAMRAVEHPEILRFFDHLPLTRAYLQDGDRLAGQLFGSSVSAMGRSSFALARLVGHVGPAVTHMHYLHGDDLVRAAVVEREAHRLDRQLWMSLIGLARSTAFALTAGGSFTRLMATARRAAGWQMRSVRVLGAPAPRKPRQADESGVEAEVKVQASQDPEPTAASPATPTSPALLGGELPGWLPISRIEDLSERLLSGRYTISQVAHQLGMDEARATSLMAGLQHWLPKVAQPGHRATQDAAAGRVGLVRSAEIHRALQQAEAGVVAGAMRDAAGQRAELEFLIGCYDRRDRDFHVKDARGLERLLGVLRNLGVRPEAAQWVVRSTAKDRDGKVLPDWADQAAFGEFANCPIRRIGVRSVAKADSYAKWLGLMPVTLAGESCGNAYAGFAALALVALERVGQEPTEEPSSLHVDSDAQGS